MQTVFTVLAPVALSGQNLDPTVEVSRVYEGKLMEVHKPYIEMAVPDSVLHFDLDFDYSVAETPYMGSYEFNPYAVEMKPAPAAHDMNSLYLRAGAGYQLHPVADIIWSPDLKCPLRMNVYGSHRSFIGNYSNVHEVSQEDMSVGLESVGRGEGLARTWKGYDLMSRAGVDGRYDGENVEAKFDMSYEGLQQKNRFGQLRSYYEIEARAGMASRYVGSGLRFKVDASYKFLRDKLKLAPASWDYVEGNEIDVDALFGYTLSGGDRAMLDLGFDFSSTAMDIVSGGGDVDVVPHYVMDRGRWRFDLGLRVSVPLRNCSSLVAYGHEVQVLYPDVRVEYMPASDAAKLYFDLGGDSKASSYSDVVRHDRHATMTYGREFWNLMDMTEERVNVALGAEGRFGFRFNYDVKAGYANVGNGVLDGVVVLDEADGLLPALGYSSYDKFYISADWLLDMNGYRFDGCVEYTNAWNLSSGTGLFLPAEIWFDLAFSYNWRNRILAGVGCQFSTARKGSVLRDTGSEMTSTEAWLPGYVDLGIDAEYMVNRKFSVWARGGNLLGMTIYRSLLYAEKGPYFTLGACLVL